VCVECLFLRTPSRAPYRTPSACAKRATYSEPPPVVPHPESIAAQAAYPYRHSAREGGERDLCKVGWCCLRRVACLRSVGVVQGECVCVCVFSVYF
jgi:hypothetical protein